MQILHLDMNEYWAILIINISFMLTHINPLMYYFRLRSLVAKSESIYQHRPHIKAKLSVGCSNILGKPAILLKSAQIKH